ncbi:hypothetical protein EVAR_65320_1 [Eumeta japonica]|uniref:Uncharacterized protein n=1 Tax=Eumeta variegata TaxID=151549 RepID=A0A4C1YUF8_EUMVA|nr:hypothetical protein EVAR_65320_1 [Eumeta japonica]
MPKRRVTQVRPGGAAAGARAVRSAPGLGRQLARRGRLRAALPPRFAAASPATVLRTVKRTKLYRYESRSALDFNTGPSLDPTSRPCYTLTSNPGFTHISVPIPLSILCTLRPAFNSDFATGYDSNLNEAGDPEKVVSHKNHTNLDFLDINYMLRAITVRLHCFFFLFNSTYLVTAGCKYHVPFTRYVRAHKTPPDDTKDCERLVTPSAPAKVIARCGYVNTGGDGAGGAISAPAPAARPPRRGWRSARLFCGQLAFGPHVPPPLRRRRAGRRRRRASVPRAALASGCTQGVCRAGPRRPVPEYERGLAAGRPLFEIRAESEGRADTRAPLFCRLRKLRRDIHLFFEKFLLFIGVRRGRGGGGPVKLRDSRSSTHAGPQLLNLQTLHENNLQAISEHYIKISRFDRKEQRVANRNVLQDY